MNTRISRHDSRIIALSALFSCHLTGKDPEQVFEQVIAFYPWCSQLGPSSTSCLPGQPGEAQTGTTRTITNETPHRPAIHRDSEPAGTPVTICHESGIYQGEIDGEVRGGGRRGGGVLSSYVNYGRNLFFAAVENLKTLDELIESRAHGWTVSRMPLVDRCILELALAEIMYAGDAPTEVVLDEAVNLAKEYGTADSPAFVNGLLVGALKEKISPE